VGTGWRFGRRPRGEVHVGIRGGLRGAVGAGNNHGYELHAGAS